MAKKEFAKNEKRVPKILRKGALCALVGTTALAGGVLAGCDTTGAFNAPAGVGFYYGTETPNTIDNPGKVGDFYIETDVGDVWQLSEDGWKVVSNIKGPQGNKGNKGDKGDQGIQGEQGEQGIQGEQGEQGEQGIQGEQGVGLVNVTIAYGFDRDGNGYLDYTFHYSNDTTTTERVYSSPVIYVGTEMTLENALEVVGVGGTIALKNDIVLDSVVTVNKRCTLDLAGRTISNVDDIWDASNGDWSLISVREGGELTIKDTGIPYNPNEPWDPEQQDSEGTIMAKANDCYAADVQDGGKLIVEGGVLVGNISSVYVYEGELIVNDGTFAIQQLSEPWNGGDERFTLNCFDENYKNGTAKITVNGGYFINYNPAKNAAEGVNTNFVSNGNMVASMEMGYAPEMPAVEIFMVVSGVEVLEAMEQGYLSNCKITLANDVTLPYMGLVINTEMAIDLNGYTISAPNDTVGDGVFHVVAGGRLTIEGDGVVDAECVSGYKMAIWADGGEVIINGGTFTNSSTEGTDDQYDLIYAKNGGMITINGGIFDCKTPKWTLNLKDNDVSTIIVRGGTFKGYDPSSSYTENPVANFVASGYKVAESEEDTNGDVWYTVYTTVQDLINTSEDYEIVLNGDLTTSDESVEAKAVITTDKYVNFGDNTITLDIPNATSETANWAGINVNGGYVIFDGDKGGITTAPNGELYAVCVRNGATLEINGGTYIGGTTAINVVQGTAVIRGGFFSSRIEGNEEANGRWTINCYDANYRNGSANVIIMGGTFVNFNPADNLNEGENTSYVAEGYTVVEEKQANGDVWYVVVPVEG